ncbi:MAG: hypothetical protein QOH88_407 [Verrucomicrobiota bacterium]
MLFGVTLLRSRGSVIEAILFPSFILLPLLMGFVAAWFWRRLGRSLLITLLDTLWTCLLGLVVAAFVLKEGPVCLMIGLPIHYILVLTGVLLGRLCFRSSYTKLQVSILPLLVLLTFADAVYIADRQAMVSDEILIRATPDKVWPHVLSFPEIPDRPDYWIFRLGLPYPTQTTNGGNFVGADRQCTFSDGIVLKEKVAEFIPNERLTFDIVEQPTHPEAYGHITLHRGRFELRDNKDGTTTLVGSSWYTLHVHPSWYFDLWTRDMTRAVHLRVMNHVRRLAEKQ